LGAFTAFTPSCRASGRLAVWEIVATFAAVFISKIPKYRQRSDGTIEKSASGVLPDSSLEQALESQRRDIVTICLGKVTNHEPRVIGPEVICRSTANRLGLMEFLLSNGFDRQEAELAVMQIIARAIYPYSEYRTVKYLRENTALAEMFHIPKEKLTKGCPLQECPAPVGRPPWDGGLAARARHVDVPPGGEDSASGHHQYVYGGTYGRFQSVLLRTLEGEAL